MIQMVGMFAQGIIMVVSRRTMQSQQILKRPWTVIRRKAKASKGEKKVLMKSGRLS